MWRMADCSNALYGDCVSPSCYSKGQGAPVRIWGMLANGHLSIAVLPERQCMNSENYAELVEENFPKWSRGCEYLVQDFESCLRSKEALAALREVGLELVKGCPRVSQDFNAIENAWKFLRERLDETMPTRLEKRAQFIARLHAAVAWVNKNKKTSLVYLSKNQKERADDCLSSKPQGARTKW